MSIVLLSISAVILSSINLGIVIGVAARFIVKKL